MKKYHITTVSVLILLLSLTGAAHAKWWIFGKAAGGLRTHYLYLNSVSFDGSVDPRMTLYKNDIGQKGVLIKGKASSSNAKIGLVQISLDNKETWQKAELSQSGSFEFAFQPEIDHTYHIYVKMTDTTGQTNDVDTTYKAVTVVDEDISGMIRAALAKLFEAYQEQDPSRFMQLVSSGFEPDAILLDTAIRKDFTTFDYIQIQHLVNTIASGSQGRVYVSLNYNRTVISTTSGEQLSDRGQTEFTFQVNSGRPELLRIKNPLLFGLSDASNVASGTVNSGSNDPILLVDEYGSVKQETFNNAITTIENGNTFSTSSTGSSGAGGILTGTFTIADGNIPVEGYMFSYSQAMAPGELELPAGATFWDLAGDPDIDTVNNGDPGGAANVPPPGPDVWSGNGLDSCSIKFSDGKYMLIQHTAGNQLGATVKYRLQTNGTANF